MAEKKSGIKSIASAAAGQALLQQVPEGHVIHILVNEHMKILGCLRQLDELRGELLTKSSLEASEDILSGIRSCAELLMDVESHHRREEQVLCLELERHGVSGPPEIMRQEHALLRPIKQRLLNLTSEEMQKKAFTTLQSEIDETIDRVISNLLLHIQKEDKVLYPTALETIQDDAVWARMREQSDKIGYCSFTPGIRNT